MGIHDNVLTDYEIKMLFDHLDTDNSGGVELTEMLEFLQTGEKNASEEQAREGKRLHSLRLGLFYFQIRNTIFLAFWPIRNNFLRLF